MSQQQSVVKAAMRSRVDGTTDMLVASYQKKTG